MDFILDCQCCGCSCGDVDKENRKGIFLFKYSKHCTACTKVSKNGVKTDGQELETVNNGTF